MELQFNKPHNLDKLADELLKANAITFDDKVCDYLDNIVLYVENPNQELINQVINAHNPTPLPYEKTETEILKEQISASNDAINMLMMMATI